MGRKEREREKSDSMAPSGLSMERLGRARLDARCSQRARVIANAVSQRSGWVTKKLNQHRSGGLGNNTLRTKAFEEEGKDDDVDFEERLAKLRAAKGTKGRGQGGKKAQMAKENSPKKVYDYTGETVFFESRPSAGDLAVNIALGATLLWLPLTFAALGRFAWVNYKITDKRVSVSNTSPVGNEDEKQLDVPYDEVTEVVAIGRGIGLWGDMVIKLKDGSKVEIRSVDKWQEVRDYIEQKAAEANPAKTETKTLDAKPVGF